MTDSKSYKIQVLRGLAILAVVFIHTSPSGVAEIWYRPFLNFAVGLFLFLSGYLSDAKRWNPKKRLIKIGVPYGIWTLVYVLIKNTSGISGVPVLYIKNLMLGTAAAIMYYVFVYCELTLLIPLIDKLARSRFRWLGFLISPLEIILMRLLPLILGVELNKYVSLIRHVSCLGWFIYFYLGYLIGNELLEIKLPTKVLVGMWIVSIVLQYAEGYWYYSMGASGFGTQSKLSSILTGVIFSILAERYIRSENAPTSKILKLMGDYSFGIFFLHLAIMSALRAIPKYNNIAIFPLHSLITASISLVVVIIASKQLGKRAKYLAF